MARVASRNTINNTNRSKFTLREVVRKRTLEINDEAKEIVQEVAAAINRAVENSTEVAESIERLRTAGYMMELTLRLEIGLREIGDEGSEESSNGDTGLDFTDEDRRTLRQMRIKIDETE